MRHFQGRHLKQSAHGSEMIIEENKNLYGFMANPKKMLTEGNNINVIGYMTEGQKKELMNIGLPEGEKELKKAMEKYLISSKIMNEINWNDGYYQSMHRMANTIKLNIVNRSISMKFNVNNIGLTTSEENRIMNRNGGTRVQEIDKQSNVENDSRGFERSDSNNMSIGTDFESFHYRDAQDIIANDIMKGQQEIIDHNKKLF